MGGHMTVRSGLRSWLTGALVLGASGLALAGCGTDGSYGRPHPGRIMAPGATPPVGAGTSGAQPAPTQRSGGGTGRHTGAPTATASGVGGLFGAMGDTSSGLWGWAMGRPPGGPGAALRGTVSQPRSNEHPSGHTGNASGTPKAAAAGRGAVAGTSAASVTLYNNRHLRALADKTNGGHSAHMGVYTAPANHEMGKPLSSPADLTALPLYTSLQHYNGYLVSYRRITPWVAHMGAHYGHRGPALVLMQNRSGQVTGAQMGFPAANGWHAWYDQPQARPAGTIYSEHLYFVPSTRIGLSEPIPIASDLSSWSRFAQVNAAKTSFYKAVGADPAVATVTQWGPPGPGVRVLVDKASHVVGLMAIWPSRSPEGWRPWFDQAQGSPIHDPILGSVYTQHLWLVDPRSL